MTHQQGRKADEESASKESSISAPAISLPKGGGAIRGMGEKFTANPVTGTGSTTVPIATSPGRSGFGPQLALSYDSGAGNGSFGFGWSLSLPSITRKTDKGLPQYRDAEESDVFILSGAEDLVPSFKPNTTQVDEFERDGYRVRRYRPRIEGLFARIEQWTNQADPSDTFWRSISKDNLTTYYGRTAESRIADPRDSTRIFSWLICQSYDDKGNAIAHEYAEENSENVDLSQVNERNRNDVTRKANRYLKHVKYGNRIPNRDADGNATDPAQLGDWMFEVVFDYEEGHYEVLAPDLQGRQFIRAAVDKTQDWPVRQDPFSSYRAGFEVRTYRLCQRVLMFHHFPDELGTADYLVRSTEFTYHQSPIASFIMQAAQSGYVRQPDGTYLKKSLPPLEFEYSPATISEEVQVVDPESLQNLPIGADGLQYQWLDLDGEGLQGVLSEQQEGWYYKRNLSPISTATENGQEKVVARFEPLTEVATQPSIAEGAGARYQFLDLAGDGNLDLVQFEKPVSGFFERTEEERWDSFIPFESAPNLRWNDPNLRFVDLTGDGHADILITENDALTWYPSLAEEGFGTAIRISKPRDEEEGPAVVFADGTQAIFVADLSGDGLADIVRIRNGEVCYWPNLGYGRFGAKVTMDNAPWFDNPDQFDQKRIRLADIDGSGTTDIIYLERHRVAIYRNECGNGWSPAEYLASFPPVDDLSSVTAVDLLGIGTACLVWSSPLPGNARRPMRYIDLMGGQKPHLLIKTVNNLGAETVVEYAPSTKFYLADKRDGKPWITRLPFPVHVVEREETRDLISRNRFVTRYAYHHGYYDGIEREFRGFGMVEQFDTEELAALTESGDFPDAVNIDAASYVPTVLTKTWFHTGAYIEGGRISRHFEDEYYHEGDESEGVSGLTDQQLEAMLLPDTKPPTTLKRQDGSSIPWEMTAEEVQEACRALKGAVLRREIFAMDGTDDEDRPYSATEQNYTVELLQPKGEDRYAVFFTHPRESIDFHYERKLIEVAAKKIADPRVTHAMTLGVDGYGNVLKSVAIGYGRRPGLSPLQGDDKDKQEQLLITYIENAVTNPVDKPDKPDDYRTPLPCEARSYELLKIAPDSNLPDINNLFGFDEMVAKAGQASDGLHDLLYEDIAAGGGTESHPYRRLIEQVRTLYRRNDLAGALPLGHLESLAIPFESYKLAFTPGLLAGVYGTKVTDAMLADDGRYVHSEGESDWWIPSGRIFFSPGSLDTPTQELAYARQHFFLPHRYRDPFHTNAVSTESFVTYDGYDLLMLETRDALGNTAQAVTDYRVLQPKQMTDPNGNRSEVVFDPLGLVAGAAVMGKSTETLGDSLAGFVADLTQSDLEQFFSDPIGPTTAALLGNATTRILYDLDRFERLGEPPFAATLARETHVSDPLPPGGLKIQVSLSYSDGFGREIQKKVQAEPGPVVEGGSIVNPRWVGGGWTIFNNKGKPVRQYEPFFDDTPDFKFGNQVGVSPILFYDPVERVVATLHPNHTWEKVVFDPWRQESWDVNDTVLFDPKLDDDVKSFFLRLPDADYLPAWYAQRQGGALGAQEQDAANKTLAHASTPSVSHADSLGRTFLTIADNAAAGQYATRVMFDIEGNQLEVVDAKDRIVMQYDYDMLSNRIHQASMEAGERWMLGDVTGKPIYAWDSRDHQFRTNYDQLRRSTDSFLRDGTGPERLIGHTVYGESRPNPEVKNQRGKVVQLFDQAGVVTSDEYDFKGNLRRSARTVAGDYKNIYDWNNDTVDPSWEIFHSSTTYDALNRSTSVTAPDNSVYRPTFNKANLLEKVEANLRGATTATPFVANIDYNAKGQRVLIEYGNHVKTEYAYDPLTFRLMNLRTTRLTDQARLQDLSYTYDPAGNITQIQDGAQQTIYFNNQVVTPNTDYTYDAIYRLIEAKGREHIGQAGQPQTNWDDQFRVHLPQPGDGQAMRRYSEQYEYDPVGNFLQLIHHATNGNWTRSYAYDETSLIEPGKNCNRLSSTTFGQTTENYSHDAHGNMTAMPHLPQMDWDFRDQLQNVDLGGGGDAYYVYDAAGQRVRKIVEKNGGTLIEERVYLGGFEIFRRRNGTGTVTLERETLHIMDDKQRIALVETRTQGTDGSPAQLIHYQYGNHLGSASLELDDQAKIISYEEYYPYGSTSYQAGRIAAEVGLKRYRYTGNERDEETGFAYHGARYYAPWLSRWSAVDPLFAEYLDIGSYGYSAANPIRYVDPAGREPEITAAQNETLRKIEAWGKEAAKFAASNDLTDIDAKLTKAEQVVEDRITAVSEERGLSRRLKSVTGDPRVVGAQREVDRLNKIVSQRDKLRAASEALTKKLKTSGLPAESLPRQDNWRLVYEKKLTAGEQALATRKGPRGGGGGGTTATVKAPPRGGGGGGTTATVKAAEAVEVGVSKGGSVVGTLAKTGRVSLKVAGKVAIAIPVAHRFFMAGYHIREREFKEAGKQMLYLLEDLNPLSLLYTTDTGKALLMTGGTPCTPYDDPPGEGQGSFACY